MTKLKILTGLCLPVLFSGLLDAQDVPQTMNVSARLTDSAGVNKPDASYPVTFSIWDQETVGAGTPLWQEQRTVTTHGGNFQVSLGGVTPLPTSVIGAPNRYLQTQVGSEAPLVPRIKLQSVPFALKSDKANKLEPNAMAQGNLTVAGALSAASLSASNLTANRVLTSGGAGNLNAGAVTTTELGHLSGVSSNIQTQLNSKAPSSRSIAAGTGLTGGGDLSADRTISLNLGSPNTWSAQQSFNAGICLSGDCRTSFPVTTSLPWTSITGIPAGFSDNVDNIGITAETDTLQSVANRGNTTSSGLTVGGLVVNGVIGIGTASPQSTLHVVKAVAGHAVQIDKSAAPSFGGAHGTLVLRNPNTSNDAQSDILFAQANGNGVAAIVGRNVNQANNDGQFEFWTRNDGGIFRRMVINPPGNVGIGTAAPIRMLDVNGSVVIRGEAHLLPDGTIDGLNVRGAGAFSEALTARSITTGDITASGTKSFIQKHPNDPNKQILYYTLEGSESGTYYRGTGQLVNGEATIELPDHFGMVTSQSALMTAQVTPLENCQGLYIVEKSPIRIVVKEIGGGTSSARFDYLVQGVRIGYENVPVIRDNPQQP
ncbi:MAG: hypothetical protein HYT79_03075 [Elusimicrobia bacterium]|nr:hypothetical protein [Elusimicrobiota bacterium]